jgi:hypothetical protein
MEKYKEDRLLVTKTLSNIDIDYPITIKGYDTQICGRHFYPILKDEKVVSSYQDLIDHIASDNYGNLDGRFWVKKTPGLLSYHWGKLAV